MDNININTKIKLKRLRQLQKQFDYNYYIIARNIFNSFDDSKRLKLLNTELYFDKKIYELQLEGRFIGKMIYRNDQSYLYSPAFAYLNDSLDQAHVRHNLYRTISVMLLDNCTLDEKIIILSKSTKIKNYKNPKMLEISLKRLHLLDQNLTTLSK